MFCSVTISPSNTRFVRSRYVPLDTCDYVVDLETPDQTSPNEPNYGEMVRCSSFYNWLLHMLHILLLFFRTIPSDLCALIRSLCLRDHTGFTVPFTYLEFPLSTLFSRTTHFINEFRLQLGRELPL